ncbi:hypothetical protein EDC01DRAFT_627842 [Geopyxis carbonaria]|nr:hypothetical protein EDC01DRAFT_627842 [Geopyxis carbonaria]
MQFLLLAASLLSLVAAAPAPATPDPSGSATSVGGAQLTCESTSTRDANFATSRRLAGAALPDMVNDFRTVQLGAGKTWGVALGLPDMKLVDGTAASLFLQIYNTDEDATEVNGQRFVEGYEVYEMLREVLDRCTDAEEGTTMGGSVYSRPSTEEGGEGVRVLMRVFVGAEGTEVVNDN